MDDFGTEQVSEAAVRSFSNTPDLRTKKILTSLVQHLHAFARDVELQEHELAYGLEYLRRCGQVTNEARDEFILLSDVLGLSMLIVAGSSDKGHGATQASVLGPFHLHDCPRFELGADIAEGAKGSRCEVRGQIRSVDGAPVPAAQIDVWHCDGAGVYDVQAADQGRRSARGRLKTDGDGRYSFRSVLPSAYSIPHDGPVGELLEAAARLPWRPAHIHFLIRAEGYRSLTTQVFRRGGDYLESDAVFGVRHSLVAEWEERADGMYVLEYDFVLCPI